MERELYRLTLTLPSMTATHELVVPRSMPIISFPEAARAALPLQHGAQLSRFPGKATGAIELATHPRARISERRA